MYAACDSDLETAKDAFFEDTASDDDEFVDPLTNYRNRVEKFLERGDEWLLVRRQDIITRGNNTNSYSESTMRILKDIILSRTKAFNVVALVDFCSTVLQTYLVRRLLAFAHGRRADPRLLYAELCDRMRHVDTADVTFIDDFRYLVPSCSRTSTAYTVDAQFGLCACISGQTGAFCKHQAFVHERFSVPFPNAPAVALADRHKLAVLALGNKCPGKDFFRSLHETDAGGDQDNIDNGELPPPAAKPHSVANTADHTTSSADEDVSQLVHCLQTEMTRIGSLVTPYTADALKAFLPCLQAVRTEQDLINTLHQCRSAVRAHKGGAIRVQPTSIARRRAGMTRGCKRVPAGRPPADLRRPHKRPRVLSANIDSNVPHAKSHGSGH